MEMLTLDAFEEAAECVKRVTRETKLIYSDYFSAQTGNKVYLKAENMQVTGAYKIRGAYFKTSTLTEEERAELAGMSLRQLEAFVPEPRNIGPDTKVTLGIEEDVRKGLYDRLGADISIFEGAEDV